MILFFVFKDYLIICKFIYYKLMENKIKKHCAIFVFGDIGRSPRM